MLGNGAGNEGTASKQGNIFKERKSAKKTDLTELNFQLLGSSKKDSDKPLKMEETELVIGRNNQESNQEGGKAINLFTKERNSAKKVEITDIDFQKLGSPATEPHSDVVKSDQKT